MIGKALITRLSGQVGKQLAVPEAHGRRWTVGLSITLERTHAYFDPTGWRKFDDW